MLRAAFFALKRDAAPGIDRLRWQDYETDLDRWIEDLHARVSRLARRANVCTGTVTVEILQLNKADICQIPGGFETTIAPLISLGNSKSRAARAGGGRNRRLTAPKHRHAPLCSHQGMPPPRRLPHVTLAPLMPERAVPATGRSPTAFQRTSAATQQPRPFGR